MDHGMEYGHCVQMQELVTQAGSMHWQFQYCNGYPGGSAPAG